jgi:hypothetical protein
VFHVCVDQLDLAAQSLHHHHKLSAGGERGKWCCW